MQWFHPYSSMDLVLLVTLERGGRRNFLYDFCWKARAMAAFRYSIFWGVVHFVLTSSGLPSALRGPQPPHETTLAHQWMGPCSAMGRERKLST